MSYEMFQLKQALRYFSKNAENWNAAQRKCSAAQRKSKRQFLFYPTAAKVVRMDRALLSPFPKLRKGLLPNELIIMYIVQTKSVEGNESDKILTLRQK